jgi:hypothetical protein
MSDAIYREGIASFDRDLGEIAAAMQALEAQYTREIDALTARRTKIQTARDALAALVGDPEVPPARPPHPPVVVASHETPADRGKPWLRANQLTNPVLAELRTKALTLLQHHRKPMRPGEGSGPRAARGPRAAAPGDGHRQDDLASRDADADDVADDDSDDDDVAGDWEPAVPEYRTPPPAARAKGFKPGTRVKEAKTSSVPIGELPWWARVKSGESMTAAAQKELERMNGSREAKRVIGRVND